MIWNFLLIVLTLTPFFVEGRGLGSQQAKKMFFSVSASAVLSVNELKVTTASKVGYDASMIFSDQGSVFDFNVAVPAVADRANGDLRPILAGAYGELSERAYLNSLYFLRAPQRWCAHDQVQADYVFADCDESMFHKALFHPTDNNAPRHKIILPFQTYDVFGKQDTSFKFVDLGVRVQVCAGGRVLPSTSCFLSASFQYNSESKGADHEETVNIVAFDDRKTEVQALSGERSFKEGVALAPYQWSNSMILKNLSLVVSSKEKFAFGVGVAHDLNAFTFSVNGGLKQFCLDLTYKGGDYAFPFAGGSYSDNYLDRAGLWIKDQDRSVSFTQNVWTGYISALVSYKLNNTCKISFSFEYSSFKRTLKSDVASKKDLINPTSLPRHQNDFVSSSFYMGLPQNVFNTISPKNAEMTQCEFALSLSCDM